MILAKILNVLKKMNIFARIIKKPLKNILNVIKSNKNLINLIFQRFLTLHGWLSGLLAGWLAGWLASPSDRRPLLAALFRDITQWLPPTTVFREGGVCRGSRIPW